MEIEETDHEKEKTTSHMQLSDKLKGEVYKSQKKVIKQQKR